jgi:shikimate dehydrogenase
MSDDVRAACVIGWPVDHSRSPLIHNYWIKQLGLKAEYWREPVRPEDFTAFVRGLHDKGYVGANVTIPHKEEAMTLAEPDEHARAVGAANTLWYDGDTLRATNTDVEGFCDSLNAQCPRWNSGLDTAMVLGAGGAARAVIVALQRQGVEQIRVVNRTASKIEALKKTFGGSIRPTRWEEVNGLLANADILVNTTSLGMTGQPPLELNMKALQPSTVVTDVVYSPLETPLLKAARAEGLRTADGLGMLLYQAVRGFSLWFGVRPEVTPELRALVAADLGGAPTKAPVAAPEKAERKTQVAKQTDRETQGQKRKGISARQKG